MDRGAWQATIYGVAKSQTQLSDSDFLSFMLTEVDETKFIFLSLGPSMVPDIEWTLISSYWGKM